MEYIVNELNKLSDKKLAAFNAKLLPTLNPETILGVKTKDLKTLAKAVFNGNPDVKKSFMAELPHTYFEENTLHMFLIGLEKDFDEQICELEVFLPYLDNWATCDQFSSKVFASSPIRLLPKIDEWINAQNPYTVRFAIKMLFNYFLKENFFCGALEKVAAVKSEHYYVNMMIAWFFATALCYRYDEALKYLTERRLNKFCHNKTIQKAKESFRLDKKQKEFLKTLRV